MSIHQGQAIIAGYRWACRIEMDVTAFPVGATFKGQVRRQVGDEQPLVQLSTEDGSLARVDDTHLDIIIAGDKSKDWHKGSVVMDLVRTDTDPDTYLGFQLTVPVALPVTRGLVP
jgi:hypothetical protein